MKVYICADIEGVAAVTSMEQCIPGNPEYERARRLMTAEVNAAIAGAFEAGATEVLVADSHYRFTNIIAEQLDERAMLSQGRPRAGSMCPGLDSSFDALLFVGHHAGSRRHGVLAHTTSGEAFHTLKVNGTEFSEVAFFGAYAGAMGVPVVLLTGDDQLMQQCADLFPGAATASVKTALGARAACSLSPARAQRLIAAKALEGLANIGHTVPYVIEGPVRFEMEMGSVAMADLVALVPSASRMSPTILEFGCKDISEAIGWMMVAVSLAGSIR